MKVLHIRISDVLFGNQHGIAQGCGRLSEESLDQGLIHLELRARGGQAEEAQTDTAPPLGASIKASAKLWVYTSWKNPLRQFMATTRGVCCR